MYKQARNQLEADIGQSWKLSAKALSMVFGLFSRLGRKRREALQRLQSIEEVSREAAAFARNSFFVISALSERLLLLEGRNAANALPDQIGDLSDAEFRISSQWGEDGIIEWLLQHSGDIEKTFIEFGVENFQEANCRFLLQHRNWRGLVMDSSDARLSELRAEALCWRYDLSAKAAFITRDNINDLVAAESFAGPLGLLSIDVDGNDYWIWKAIDRVEPAIVVCEYNSILGDVRPISIPYDPDFRRFSAEPSGLYFGCSIAALRRLGSEKGYTFVGTNSNGINAFFVRDDLAKGVLSKISRARAFPSRHRDSRDSAGRMTFARGQDRLRLIEDLPIVDVSTGETLRLRDIGQPYSDEWLAGMG